jgi:mannose-1-phosphate guanylyltransferase
MTRREDVTRRPRHVVAGAQRGRGALWALVLAGGEGTRLRPLVRQVCGDERPKQFVPLLESRSLLQQTVDRLPPLVPAERTVLVTMWSHLSYLSGALGDLRFPRVLAQPQDRGTAAAILLGAHWIRKRDPDATILVLPSDHLIVEEALFMGHVASVERFVQQHPAWMVLLGAQPTEPETEYGWIEAGARAGWTREGPLYRVFRFWEKPSRELSATLFANGCLWNTFVLVAAARTLVASGEECVPDLNDRLSRLSLFFGTEEEGWALSQAYARAPRENFSRSVLQRCPGALAVSKLPTVTWSDLGTPARVVRAVSALGLAPPWFARLSAS